MKPSSAYVRSARSAGWIVAAPKDGHVYATLVHVMNELRLDPDNHYVHAAISKVSGLSTRRLEELSLGTFVYAAVFLTEGGGLLLRKRWAEYLTTIVTASFVPFEGYELVHAPSILKAAGLALNLAIVGYLAWGLLSPSASAKRRR